MNNLPHNPRAYGQQIEALAEQFLRSQGLRALERNFTMRGGEIDLIMQHEQVLVFVEVRYRANHHHGSGAESITPRKQQRLRRTAEYYLVRHFGNQLPDCRFDVISASGNPIDFDWIQNAF